MQFKHSEEFLLSLKHVTSNFDSFWRSLRLAEVNHHELSNNGKARFRAKNLARIIGTHTRLDDPILARAHD